MSAHKLTGDPTVPLESEQGRAGEAEEMERGFRLCLLNENGDQIGRFAADRPVTTLGTHKSNVLVFDDPTMSRFHAEILVKDRKLVIRDRGSRNGTRLDAVRVEVAELHKGCVLEMGNTRFRFEIGKDAPSAELAGQGKRGDCVSSFGRMVGRSDLMRAVFTMLERAAVSDSTVLLTGETGTGKDIAAASIHERSARACGPFVSLDCSSLPHNLIESELFGHVRGSFTGADRDRKGALERAHGGTLFLDELGELPLEHQSKLLRALETRAVRPVGGTADVPVDVRFIVATNRELDGEVAAGRFRSDLYYRVAVFSVRLPPLRDRPEDIGLLVQHLAAGIGDEESSMFAHLGERALLRQLERHTWPGNVRELRNYVEKFIALGAGEHKVIPLPGARGTIDTFDPDRPPIIDLGLPLRAARRQWTGYFERQYLRRIMARSGNKITVAARDAGVDRVYFWRLLGKAGLR